MHLRVRSVDLHRSECRARLPFKFGAATMESAPLLAVRLTAETADGRAVEGAAADLLVPKWFDKDPQTSVAEDRRALVAAARAAGRAAVAAGTDTPFALWWRAYRDCVPPEGEPSERLVRGFGVALVERALIDAACRAAGASFFDALRANLLGFEPGRVHSELAGWDLAAGLGPPLERVRVRHTIGMLDPLSAADVPQEERVADGLPQALDEDVRAYGLDRFKVKIGQGRAPDRERLAAIAAVLDGCGVDWRLTLDANEQYEDLEELGGLFADLADCPRGREILGRTLFLEQPLPRGLSLDPVAARGIAGLALPAILDEADAGVETFPRALALGWRGVSVKNCKGVFRALLNRGLCERTPGAFQSAEDLTNLPILALHEDLATVAALGLAHVERNGHHYFPRLAHLAPDEAEEALARHPDLYVDDGGGPRLAIERGELALGSLACEGYGYAVRIRWDERELIGEALTAPAEEGA